MTWLFALLGIGLHLGTLAWSMWLQWTYRHRWLLLFPIAIFMSTVYAIASLVHDGRPAWWQTVEFSLVFYGVCLIVGGAGLHLGLVRYKKRVESLDETVAMFQEFSETAPVGFFLYQDDHFRIGNDLAVNMTGYTRDELVAMNYWDIVAPEAREYVKTYGTARLAGQNVPGEVQLPMITKSGELRWCHLNTGTVTFNGRPAGLGIVVDITQRRIEQERLRKSESNLRLAQQIASIGSYEIDLLHPERSLWSEENFRIAGIPVDPGLKAPTGYLRRFVHPDDQDRLSTQIKRIEKTGENLDIAYRILRPDQSIRWVHDRGWALRDGEGQVVAIHGTRQDIHEQHEAERNLRFRSELLNRIGEAVVAKDLEGRITYANEAARHMFAIVGIDRFPFDVAPFVPIEKQIQNLPGVLETLRAGDTWTGEGEGNRIDGSSVPVFFTISPLTDADGTLTGLIAVATDISARKQAEAALRLSEERLRLAIQAGRLSVWDWDVDHGMITYTTTDADNPRTISYVGMSLEDVLQPIPPGDREALLGAVRHSHPNGGAFEHEHRIMNRYGAERWMHTSGQCYYAEDDSLARVIGISRNITKRKHTEEALRARTMELENISDHVPYQIIRFDADHRILSANRAALEIAGLSHHDYKDQRLDRLGFSAELANQWRKHINEVFTTARPVEMEYDQHLTGGTCSFGCLLVPEFDPHHEVRSVMVICRDVTERKQLQKEVLEISTREQRRIGQDLHDGLGQLLTGIGFKVAGLQQEVRDHQPITDASIREISMLVERAIGLTRQLAEGLDPVTVDMRGIQDGLQRLALQTEHIYGIPCSLIVDTQLPALHDEVATQVYRIAQEAVNNAVKHADPSAIQIRLNQEFERIVLRVTDNGCGFTADRHRGGLGLRIMDYRAKMIAGEFQIMPNPAGGSIVTCRFNHAPSLASHAT
ncbi:MAG: PAS domain S-box protein [Rhodothermales bacterium]